MTRVLKAAFAFFLLVFALGFILGTIRVLLLAPRLGEGTAVLLELPVMLAASWVASGWAIRRFSVREGWTDRLLMGGIAFALLMAAEFALSVLGFGRSAQEHFVRYVQSGAGMLGLAAQGLFGLMPLLRLVAGRIVGRGDLP